MAGQETGFIANFVANHPVLFGHGGILPAVFTVVFSKIIDILVKAPGYFYGVEKIRKTQDFVKRNLEICDLLDKTHFSSESNRIRRLVRTDVTNLVTLMSKWDAARKPRDNAVLRWLVVGPYDQKFWVLACRIILLLIFSLGTAVGAFWCTQHGSFQDIFSRVGISVLIVWVVGFFIGFVLISRSLEKYPGRPIGLAELGLAVLNASVGGMVGLSSFAFLYSISRIN